MPGPFPSKLLYLGQEQKSRKRSFGLTSIDLRAKAAAASQDLHALDLHQ